MAPNPVFDGAVADSGEEAPDVAVTPSCTPSSLRLDVDGLLSGGGANEERWVQDLLLVDGLIGDEIIVLYQVQSTQSLYARRFTPSGEPISSAVLLGRGVAGRGKFTQFGGALAVVAGTDDQAAINFMRVTLEEMMGFQSLQPAEYRGQPVYGAHPSITRVDDTLVVSWRDHRMERSRVGQNGFQYSIRALRIEPDGQVAEALITPDERNVASLAGISVTSTQRVENGAAVYAGRQSGEYYAAVVPLPAGDAPFIVQRPILFSRMVEDWFGSFTVYYTGETAALAWLTRDRDGPSELRLQVGADPDSEGEVLSQSAEIAQMVDVEGDGYLLWADQTPDGQAWFSRNLSTMVTVEHVIRTTNIGADGTQQTQLAPVTAGPPTRAIFARGGPNGTIDVVTAHQGGSDEPIELWLSTFCVE